MKTLKTLYFFFLLFIVGCGSINTNLPNQIEANHAEGRVVYDYKNIIPSDMFSPIPFVLIDDYDDDCYEHKTIGIGFTTSSTITIPLIPLEKGWNTGEEYNIVCQGIISFFPDEAGKLIPDSIEMVRLEYILVTKINKEKKERVLYVEYNKSSKKGYRIINYKNDRNINKEFLEAIKNNYLHTIKGARFNLNPEEFRDTHFFYTLPYRIRNP